MNFLLIDELMTEDKRLRFLTNYTFNQLYIKNSSVITSLFVRIYTTLRSLSEPDIVLLVQTALAQFVLSNCESLPDNH